MLVSPRRNQISSCTIDFRCSFLVVTSGKPSQIEAHLLAEHAARAGAGAVGFFGAMFEHMAQEVEVLARIGRRIPDPLSTTGMCQPSLAGMRPAS